MRSPSRRLPDRRPKGWAYLCLLLGIALLSASGLFGQTQNGSIVGTVKDTSGGVVPNVKITATQLETGLSRIATTDRNGAYRISQLPYGNYTITAEASGFKKYINSDVHLQVNVTLRVDVTLEVGAVSQQVTVKSAAPIITTDTGEVSATQRPEFLEHHPADSWNTAWQVASTTIAANASYMQFYGNPATHTAVTMDGINFRSWSNYIMTAAVQEIKVDALDAPAQYQKPATMDVTMKGGGNAFHGRADFNLDQKYFWANPNPRDHTPNCSPGRLCTGIWRAGLSGGGPVYLPKIYDGRNRTFWHFTITPQKYSSTVQPTALQSPNTALRSGDVSSIVSTSSKTCNGVPCIINPFTGQPFPNNVVTDINPVSAKLIPLWPPTTEPNGYAARGSMISQGSWYTIADRIDQKITNRNLLTFSMSYYHQTFGSNWADRSVPGWMGFVPGLWKSGVYAFGDTHTFSPTVVNEVRFGWNWNGPAGYLPTEDVPARIASLGLTGIPPARINLPFAGPGIFVGSTGGYGLGSGFTPFAEWSASYAHERAYQISDKVSIVMGSHTLNIGGDWRATRFHDASVPGNLYPDYSFDGSFTGSAWADFLLGLPHLLTRTDARSYVNSRKAAYSAYFQDDWRARPNLTLNLGVRYDRLNPQHDASGYYYSFDPATGNIVVPNEASLKGLDPAWPIATNPIVTAAAAGFPSQLYNPDNKLSPRIAFAYRPLHNDKLVVRGGYGIYVVTDDPLQFSLLQTGGPYALSTSFYNTWNGVANQPVLQWPLGWPAGGGALGGIPTTTGINKNYTYPYNQQWNLTIERALTSRIGVRISYVGQKNTNLGYVRNIDTPRASTTPFDPCTAAGQATPCPRYVYPNYSSVSYLDNGSNGNYNSFQTQFTFRGVAGLTGQFGYAYAKQINDTDAGPWDGLSMTASSTGGIQDPYCRRCNRGPGNFVAANTLLGSWSWFLPVGNGQTFASHISKGLNALIGNWEMTGTINARSGLPFNVNYVGSDPSNTNTFSGRPDYTGGGPVITGSPDQWYDPTKFTIPATCQAGQQAPCGAGRYGSLGRNVFHGPNFFRIDMGIYKFFPIKENRARIVWAMTTENLLNHPNWWYSQYPWAGPGPMNSPQPGYISGLAGSPFNYDTSYMRVIKFDLAFEF